MTRRWIAFMMFALVIVPAVHGQGVDALRDVVAPCENDLILRIRYRGFGFIPLPTGELTYYQLCGDGKYAYQTEQSHLRSGVLTRAQYQRLRAELESEDVTRLEPRYFAPRSFVDASVELEVAILTNTHLRVVHVENAFVSALPPGLKGLLSIVDEHRRDAGFSVVKGRMSSPAGDPNDR